MRQSGQVWPCCRPVRSRGAPQRVHNGGAGGERSERQRPQTGRDGSSGAIQPRQPKQIGARIRSVTVVSSGRMVHMRSG